MDVDTIASVSTPPGLGAIAIVRISGPEASKVLMRLAPALESPPGPRRATLVELTDPDDGESLDRAIATYFPGPASYTGEDMVELSCHGGTLIPGLVLDASLRAGARRAEPGEFTRRAYLLGKLDLVQAEAVSDLIEARSRALHRAALGQLERGLSRRLTAIREGLIGLEALLVHHIDFPEEDDPPVSRDDIAREAATLVGALDRMLATAPEGELLRDGALTVLAGRPNAGKSSLYNALIGEDRAIVTEEAGTTRDALETTVQLAGFPFRLVDTAGLRDSSEKIERMGIEVARRYIDRADLVLLCVPAADGPSDADRAFVEGLPDTPVVLIETMADRLEGGGEGPSAGSLPPVAGCVRLSVETGRGLDELKRVLPELSFATVVSASAGAPIVTRRRHARALETARREIEAFRTGLLDGLPAEVASTHLRPAETALEEVLGVVSLDDVLDVVFREFCVGK